MERIKNLPNAVTLFRILLIPVLFILITQKQTPVFTILLVIAGLCDGVDGFLARRLKQQTKFGTKFDSITDLLYFLSVAIWFWMLFPNIVAQNKTLLFSLLILTCMHYAYSLIKFKTITSYHLYSTKILVGLLYLFFIYWLVFGFNNLLFTILIVLACLVVLENFVVSILLKTEKQNLKSLLDVVKK